MKSSCIVGAVAISLVLYEIGEVSEPAKFFRAPYRAVDSAQNTLIPSYHTHTEMSIDSYINLACDVSVSGANAGREFDRYRLHLLPVFTRDEKGCDKIARIDLIGYSVQMDRQHMYGKFDTLEDLAVLTDKLHLPAVQVQAIRNTLLAGDHSEVGGRISALTFLAKSLRDVGMSFGPPA